MRSKQISPEQREEIAEFLISHADDISVRRRLAPEIFRDLQSNPKLQTQEFKGFYFPFRRIAREYAELGNYNRRLERTYRDAESKIRSYCERQDVFENYIENIREGLLPLGEESIHLFEQRKKETPSSSSNWTMESLLGWGRGLIYISLSYVANNPVKSFVIILSMLSTASAERPRANKSGNTNTALLDLSCPPQFQNAKNIFFFGCSSCCDNDEACIENTLQLSQEILPKAEKAGYTIAPFLGENATVENYQQMLMCENLKVFYSVASHDDAGKSFFLSDGIFDYEWMQTNRGINYKDTIFLVETCFAFDAPTGGGLCPAFTDYTPKLYLSGITYLSFWGATETYGCMMRAFLNGVPITSKLLNHCAIENSPFVPNSRAGFYAGGKPFDQMYPDKTTFIINTTLNNSYVLKISNTTLRAIRFHLDVSRNETISGISAEIAGEKTLNCSQLPGDSPQILSNPLKAAEIAFMSQNGSCLFGNVLTMAGNVPIDHFGIYPEENCTNLKRIA